MTWSVPSQLVAFLVRAGCGQTPHSGGSLLDHLVGTARLVANWGGRHDEIYAAALHSIYGTESFGGPHWKPNRADVVALVGFEAEELVHLFSNVSRQSIYRSVELGASYCVLDRNGRPVALTRAEMASVVLLLWANAIEQAPRRDVVHTRSMVRLHASKYKGLLSERVIGKLYEFSSPIVG